MDIKTALDLLVYTAGKIRQYMRVDQAPFFFIAILSAFKSFLTADIYRYTERVKIDLRAVKMRLKEIFASPRAQHTASPRAQQVQKC